MKQKNIAVAGRREKVTVGLVMIYVILGIATLFSFIPFWHIIACSFSASEDVVNTPFLLFPKHFTLDTMRYVFSSKNIVNSVLITAVGTVLSLSMTALMAYPLSRKNLRFRNQIMFILVLTMVFHPGMIPNFLNVKSFGLYNSRWALILPGMIGTYNLVLVRNFYESLPESMIESAKIDGASDWKIFTKMVIPLSKPIYATVGLFYAVGYWNSYVDAILFLDKSKLWPIQVWLRNIVLMAQLDLGAEAGSAVEAAINLQSLRSATILIATIPILLVYPFVQKHFVKGIMLGSVKG